MAHPVVGNFGVALPPGETRESLRIKFAAKAAAQNLAKLERALASRGMTVAPGRRSDLERRIALGAASTAPTPATRSVARPRPQFISLTERPVAEIRARNQPPGVAAIRAPEQRGFVHKRVLGFVGKQIVKRIPGGQIALDIGKSIRSSLQQQKRPPVALPTFAPPGAVPLSFGPGAGAPAAQVAIPRTAAAAAGPQGEAVLGAFDLPAIVPLALQSVTLDCPPGMVLGKDNLCYPRQVLGRNNQFRKWRSAPRPSISRRDERCLAAVDAVQKKLKTLGKKAGLKVTG